MTMIMTMTKIATSAALLIVLTVPLLAQVTVLPPLEWPGVPIPPPGSTYIVRVSSLGPGTLLIQQVTTQLTHGLTFIIWPAVPINSTDYCVHKTADLLVAGAVVTRITSAGLKEWVQYIAGKSVISLSLPNCRTAVRFSDPVYDVGLPLTVGVNAAELPPGVKLNSGAAVRLGTQRECVRKK